MEQRDLSASPTGIGATLRMARTADAARIAQVHLASWRATYVRELTPAFLKGQDVNRWIDRWRDEIAAGVIVILAEKDELLAGFVACGRARGGSSDPDEWEIYNLHVQSDYAGRGVGTALFLAAVAEGRRLGVHELVLWVVRTNAVARAFYERRGMRPDGAEQMHDVGGEVLREVRYRVALQPC